MGNYVGVIGMGVMGQSLALNIANHGYAVSVYNRHGQVTKDFMDTRAKGHDNITAAYELKDFVASLDAPRKVILMVKAGPVVDAVTDSLLPYLEKGDIVIDAGNSYFEDTKRRMEHYEELGVSFFGMGVSGGEKGALLGPSIMPSGDRDLYDRHLRTLLTDISAHTEDGSPCCDYIGPEGSGQYVKMVHNGIEYGDIQIIDEAYFIMKHMLGMTNAQMADTFEEWNNGRLDSFLVEITYKILRVKDPETGDDLIDHILDEAGQKGTGMWTAIEGLKMYLAIPTMAEAVFARNLSAVKGERVIAAGHFPERPHCDVQDKRGLLEDLEQAVYASKIMSYAQGFQLLAKASDEYGWDLKLGDIALLWREGCIIRAKFLGRIKAAYDNSQGKVQNLMLTDEFMEEIRVAVAGWRRVVAKAIEAGLYVPTIANSLLYFDGYTSEKLPANLCQAQRDWFGAHTYRRDDQPHDLSFHHPWEELG
ncbi:NADP-dependent phosphogluconate dehydrogenase [Olsenella sp. HMSC062G07]|uniref:NADP-dependent phosphogluconate dehydrogenase n=1 Tax=Olsenella sp. HMSC062G07 TaxID=1739330 RepID=UPI0008A55B10|nr:NADP-dependent phosphogluconate dehydrogenase [Olsenella sp. HMSC062G07]OFK23695.1 phosphogluconate dehydrogenase (NADP(+)-dependent, decarboxylating) [Olsenella sp. HMSC062G07]